MHADVFTTRHPQADGRSTDRIVLGPDLPEGLSRRLLGDVAGKRVLELGCGMGHASVAMAIAGAKVIAVDPDDRQLDHARRLADRVRARVELHRSDPAGLAFLRADSIDLIVSIYALAHVDNLDRVFRQAHRILRRDAPFVLTLPHPGAGVFADGPYFDRAGVGGVRHHLIGDVFAGLTRANFRVDILTEPEYPDGPRTLVVRARKEGV